MLAARRLFVNQKVHESFGDQFDRTDGSTLGAPWIDVVPGFTIQFADTWAHADHAAISVVDSGHADLTITAIVGDFPQQGVCFRLTDASNYWYVSRDGIYKLVAGASSLQASIVLDSGYVPQIILSGPSITVNATAGQHVTLTDSFNQTATKHGVWANSLGGNIQEFAWNT